MDGNISRGHLVAGALGPTGIVYCEGVDIKVEGDNLFLKASLYFLVTFTCRRKQKYNTSTESISR